MSNDTPPAVAAEQKLVTVYHANKTSRTFIHDQYRLEPGGQCSVPQDVADRWLSFNYYGSPEVVQRAEDVGTAPSEQLRTENTQLSEENQALSDRLAEMEKLLLAAGGKVPPKPAAPIATLQGEAASGLE